MITQGNGAVEDYSSVAGSKTCPFKIKVKDYTNPTQEINDAFSKCFNLSEISFPSVSIYQNVEEQIQMTNDILKLYAALLLVLCFISIGVIFQSISTYLEYNKSVLAIKKLLGYRYADKYTSYYGALFLCYAIATTVAYIVSQNELTLVSSAIFLAVDCIFSIVYTIVMEHKNVLQVTKGG